VLYDGDESGIDCGGVCPACLDCPGTNGTPDFCSTEGCLCQAGEGECDNDDECSGDLVCGSNNGLLYGMPADFGVCWGSHCNNAVKDGDETGIDCGGSCPVCPTCPGENGSPTYCSTEGCLCQAGEGDCDNDDECAGDLECGSNLGILFGMPINYGVCWGNHCNNGSLDGDETEIDCGGSCPPCSDKWPRTNGTPAYCTIGPDLCQAGEGDCDDDNECAGDLVCGYHNGPLYGMPDHYDVCWGINCDNNVQDTDEDDIDCGGPCMECPGSTTCPGTNGTPTFCSTDGCLCQLGEGDCDNDNECAAGLRCGWDRGADFQMPAHYDVCVTRDPEFVALPPGSFWMGIPNGNCPAGYPGGEGEDCPDESTGPNDKGLHYVTLTHGFELMRHEVTNEQFEEKLGRFCTTSSCDGDHEPCIAPVCPQECVKWYDAVAYANELSKSDGLTECYAITNVVCLVGSPTDPTDYMACFDDDATREGIESAQVTLNGGATTPYECTGYRLPTEAEWEYAIRAGSHTAYYPSDGNDGTLAPYDDDMDSNLDQIAWYGGLSSIERPQSVGGKERNAWGLYDMSGNVEEWVWDWYSADYYTISPAVDPAGPEQGTQRVLRGGYYYSLPSECRSAYRKNSAPELWGSAQVCLSVGFRLARTL